MVTLCLTFRGTVHLFSKAVVPFYFLASTIWEFQSLHILITLATVCLFLITILISMKWYPIVILICIFLKTIHVVYFSCLYWPFVCFLWSNVYSNPLPLFKMWDICLLLHCKSSLCILDTNHLSYKCFAKNFPIALAVFSLDSILWHANVFNLDEVQFIILFCCLRFWCHSYETIA